MFLFETIDQIYRNNYMLKNVKNYYQYSVRILEKILGFLVLIFVVISAINSTFVLVGMDWGQTSTFYEMLNRFLILVIGLEFVRLLISYNLNAVLELLAFVIARKMLKPDITSTDVLFNVVAFGILVLVRSKILPPK